MNTAYHIDHLPTLDEYRQNLLECGKKPATIESYARDAKQFMKFCQNKQIKVVEPICIRWFGEFLEENGEKANSIRRSIIGVRQFMRFHFDRHQLTSPFDESHIPSRQEILPDYLDASEIEKIFQACKKTEVRLKELRDQAIISLLGYEGLKASELIQLEWSHFIWNQDFSMGSLKIFGAKTRTIELYSKTTQALKNYKDMLNQNGESFEKVFVGFKGKKAQAKLTKMSRHGLKFMLSEVGDTAQIKGLSSEKLRHHAIAFMITHNKSPEEVMAHLGLKRLGNIAKFVHTK